jgi:hypothetical protein
MDVLVEAERKYMTKLVNAMSPVMINAFLDLFQEAKVKSQGKNVLLQYQALLVEIKAWNNTIVRQHTENIIKTCAIFPNLLAAVFVILVKIMSSIKITSESKKLNIKLPTNDIFVHSCYMEMAKDIYEEPRFMINEMTDNERRVILQQKLCKSIHEVVDSFVPVQQILDTYIPSCLGNELDMGEHDTIPEPEPEPEPMETNEPEAAAAPEAGEPETALEQAVEQATAPSETLPTEEVKTVQVEKPKVHEETLFDDAPDKK